MPSDEAQTVAQPRNPRSDVSGVDIHDRLDALWQQYLTNLDRYQTAQRQLQKHFSDGSFSLTQAKFKAQNGRRYGQDSYDERLKASRRAALADDGSTLILKLTATGTVESNHAKGPDLNDEKAQQPTPPATPVAEDDEPSPAAEKDDGSEEPPPDPLRMFGILVPPTLRSAQASFSAAFDAPMTDAVNAAKAMRATEADIRKLRKTIRKSERLTQ